MGDTVAGMLRSYWRFIVLAAVVVGLFALVITVLPSLLASGTFETDAERLKAENDVRATLLQALAGAFLLLGLIFTARTVRINSRTLELSREGQITERFTKAIDQLGNEKSLDVRLGGIYALERIAKDSVNDREAIHSVLAAFIRQHAPRQPDKELQDGNAVDRRPSEDVQVAATVLGRRPAIASTSYLLADPDPSTVHILDLSRADLYGANLKGANLIGADLRSADLGRAYLVGAKLAFAVLSEASLEDAVLAGAVLRGADLTRANLAGAVLTDADLTGAALAGANLADAFLTDADLTRAWLEGAVLADATGLDLGRYISELALPERLVFLMGQSEFLYSLSREALTAFSLSPEDLAEVYERATLDSQSEGETGGAIA